MTVKNRISSPSLMQRYNKLPIYLQKIMLAKAVCYKLSRKKDFMDVVLKSSITGPGEKRLYYQNLNPLLKKLQELGLLDDQLNCAESILHDLCIKAFNENEENKALSLAVYNNLSCATTHFVAEYDVYNQEMKNNNIRLLQMAVYTNNETIFPSDLSDPAYNFQLLVLVRRRFYNMTIDFAWFKTRSEGIQQAICLAKFFSYYAPFKAEPVDLSFWLDYYKNSSTMKLTGFFQYLSWQVDLALGQLNKIKLELKQEKAPTDYMLATQGSVYFLSGKRKEALASYELALKFFRKRYNKRTWFFDDIHGLFCLILMIVEEENFVKAAKSSKAALKHGERGDLSFRAMDVLTLSLSNERNQALELMKELRHSIKYYPYETSLFTEAWVSIVAYWISDADHLPEIQQLTDLAKTYEESLPFLAYCYNGLAYQSDKKESLKKWLSASAFSQSELHELVTVKPLWEQQLEQLETLIVGKKESLLKAPQAQQKRLIWLLDPQSKALAPMEQRCSPSGKWSKGKAIALKRLYNHDGRLDYLTDQDWLVVNGLDQSRHWGYYGQVDYEWNIDVALPKLVNHPFIFHKQNPTVSIELVKGMIELNVEEIKSGYSLSLSVLSDTAGVQLEQESGHRYRVIEFLEKDVEVSQIISNKGLHVPQKAKESILSILQSAHPNIQINTDVTESNVQAIEGDSTCCLQLLPVNEGLTVTLWVRPFGEQGPYCRAGEGKKVLFSTIKTEEGEERQKAKRDFAKEKSDQARFLAHCAAFHEEAYENEWHIDNPADCLELLSHFESYQKEHPLRLEWPRGQSYRLAKIISHEDIRFSVKSNQQWFEYEGEISLDEEKTLQMSSLMSLLETSEGRFIQLDSGVFIGLTQRLKRQLAELHAASEEGRVYHLGARTLESLVEEIDDISYDQQWEDHVARIKSMSAYQPKIPSTLQATLRDYQVDGFRYLERLSHWGVGACLADDMGLGKTIQAIALLLSQGSKGPSLVVAPTSVCFNWVDEINRFAPALTTHVFQLNERENVIKQLAAHDVLICSYGLLVQMSEELTKQAWQVVVLDEAQSIKNAATKRWKAAVKLQSACRLALTGTPIENHLGELWSIFRFINPGLLSTQKNFQEKYLTPIEKYQNPVAKQALKSLVSPYLLRRIKSEVLDELPPKTEQTILVEPSAEEIAFYDAVRLRALNKINKMTEENATQKRFTILAEITKLRQACCDATLIKPDFNIENSKIKHFMELMSGLHENAHKALVFSQFVRYLWIIRSYLDKAGIPYQYIDGQTSAAKRKKAVEAFQAGEGDVFLLSLKAGGTGLNLTAADYVIHLDPWWNPAVEDQASDRAHRIGQQRPVTVYRLIMKNTIEEKMIKLHAGKRTLAAELLSGGDMSGKLSEDELIRLIG